MSPRRVRGAWCTWFVRSVVNVEKKLSVIPNSTSSRWNDSLLC